MANDKKTGNGYDTFIHVKFPGGYFGGSVIPIDSVGNFEPAGKDDDVRHK